MPLWWVIEDGDRNLWEISVLSAQYCCGHKSLLKEKKKKGINSLMQKPLGQSQEDRDAQKHQDAPSIAAQVTPATLRPKEGDTSSAKEEVGF